MNALNRYAKIGPDGNPAGEGDKHVAVIDNKTGLMWAVDYATKKPVKQPKAVEAAAAVDLLGHGDWRLPSLDELESIRDITRVNPAIDVDAFPGTKSDWHWTASPWAGSPASAAWVVYFYGGGASDGVHDGYGFVRAVRSVSPAASGQ